MWEAWKKPFWFLRATTRTRLGKFHRNLSSPTQRSPWPKRTRPLHWHWEPVMYQFDIQADSSFQKLSAQWNCTNGILPLYGHIQNHPKWLILVCLHKNSLNIGSAFSCTVLPYHSKLFTGLAVIGNIIISLRSTSMNDAPIHAEVADLKSLCERLLLSKTRPSTTRPTRTTTTKRRRRRMLVVMVLDMMLIVQ